MGNTLVVKVHVILIYAVYVMLTNMHSIHQDMVGIVVNKVEERVMVVAIVVVLLQKLMVVEGMQQPRHHHLKKLNLLPTKLNQNEEVTRRTSVNHG